MAGYQLLRVDAHFDEELLHGTNILEECLKDQGRVGGRSASRLSLAFGEAVTQQHAQRSP